MNYKITEKVTTLVENLIKEGYDDEAMPNPVTQQWMTSPCRENCVKVLEDK